VFSWAIVGAAGNCLNAQREITAVDLAISRNIFFTNNAL
jgi:hypothetical protein